MPAFHYLAYSSEGQREEGSIDAANEAKAWESLAALGLTVVTLSSDGGVPTRRSFALSGLLGTQVPIAAQADLAEQLAMLFAAKLPATEIVRMVTVGSENPVIRRHFVRMGRLLADGVDFPHAFERAGPGFSALFQSLVRVGHTTADPALIMQKLATALRRQEKLQSEISGALVYPFILMIGGIAVFLLMVLYLAPSLEPMFASVGRPVPAAIGFFLNVRAVLLNLGPFLAIAVGLIAVLAIVSARSKANVVKRLFLHLPVWGSIARNASLARLARSLHLMLVSGIPLSQALHRTSEHMVTEPFSEAFSRAAVAVETGGTAAAIFAESPQMPPVFRELFGLGEKTNALPGIMNTLASLLEDGVERKTQRLTKLITPVLTLVIGGGVGALVYSVMAAILSVNELAF